MFLVRIEDLHYINKSRVKCVCVAVTGCKERADAATQMCLYVTSIRSAVLGCCEEKTSPVQGHRSTNVYTTSRLGNQPVLQLSRREIGKYKQLQISDIRAVSELNKSASFTLNVVRSDITEPTCGWLDQFQMIRIIQKKDDLLKRSYDWLSQYPSAATLLPL